MADIFISYAREDHDAAERLAEELRAAGLTCWWDARLLAGARFMEKIEAELNAAKVVVVMWSEHSITSHWVIDEACVGRDRGCLAPVVLDGAMPPLGFRQFQTINFASWLEGDDTPVQELLEAIGALQAPGDPDRLVISDKETPPAPHHEVVLQRPAVAVMPFLNLSGDASQEYFVDGITEDLITSLSAWRWFPVIARNSTFAYKGRTVDVMQVGRDLKARYLLQGSVRRSGDRVRLNAQLVETASGHQIWAHTYDRQIGDVFALEDEITDALIAAVEPQLSHAEQQRASRKPPESVDAWDLSLQGLAEIRKGTVQALERAEGLLQRAVEMDCQSSYAQSLLALACFHGALAGWSKDPAGSMRSTYDAAAKAVELDDGDWLAHALLGIASLWRHGAYEHALAEEERAIALNPSAAMAYHFYGCAVTFNGQPEIALPRLSAVLQLDPHFQLLPTTYADIGLAHFLLEDHAQAEVFCRKAMGEQRDHVRAWQRLAATYGAAGRLDEAAAAMQHVLKLQPDFSEHYLTSTYPFRNPAHGEAFRAGLLAAGWQGAAIDQAEKPV